jgi:hypothetical protein
MVETRISYTPRSDASDVAEATALANAYCLILESAKKRGRLLDKCGPDDPERRSDEIRAKTRIP